MRIESILFVLAVVMVIHPGVALIVLFCRNEKHCGDAGNIVVFSVEDVVILSILY